MAAPFCRCPLMAACACVRSVCLCLCIAHTIARTYISSHICPRHASHDPCVSYSLSLGCTCGVCLFLTYASKLQEALTLQRCYYLLQDCRAPSWHPRPLPHFGR